MRSRKEDLVEGDYREVKNTERIGKFLNRKMVRLQKGHTMDWKDSSGEVYWAEQKGRRITSKQLFGFQTAIIGKNKVDYIAANGGKGTLFFDCLDGLWAVHYDHELFKTFQVQQSYQRSQRSDCEDKPSDVVHIPVEHLISVP